MDNEPTRALIGARLFDGERFLDHHAVVLQGEQITALMPQHEVPAELPITDLQGGLLAPGFIDLQVNGGGGVLFNNAPTVDSLALMTRGHRTAGTTRLLPTTISDTEDNLQACVAAVLAARAYNPGLLGLHIEGPFFSHLRRGVHREDYLRPLRDRDVDYLIDVAAVLPILLTLAPERTTPGQIRRLVEAGIRVSAGHSNATQAQVAAAISEGLSGFTHLFNAMRNLEGREPGVVGAALVDQSTWAGIIVDGWHVHPQSVRLAWQSKPDGHLYLVSDAMATVGTADPEFDLYGERIRRQEGRLINSEGKLAGSAIGLAEAVRNVIEQVGLPAAEALRMAALYPATYFGVADRLGRLAPGYQADLVHLTDDWQVTRSWVAGQCETHPPVVQAY